MTLISHAGSDEAVLYLEDPRCVDPNRAGNKASTLARLVSLHFPIPRGFCITTGAIAGNVSVYRKQIEECAASLVFPLAARSSSTIEDSPRSAFAGQFRTVLAVRSIGELFNAVSNISDLSSNGTLHQYAAQRRVAVETISMAILVQSMVDARVAGVAFSVDPRTGKPVVCIDSSYGLGNQIVDGSITPDSIEVDPDESVRIISIGSKKQMTTMVDQRLYTSLTSPARASVCSLSNREARAIADLVRRVENEFGCPQDVEWAISDTDELVLLQARPITSTVSPSKGRLP